MSLMTLPHQSKIKNKLNTNKITNNKLKLVLETIIAGGILVSVKGLPNYFKIRASGIIGVLTAIFIGLFILKGRNMTSKSF